LRKTVAIAAMLLVLGAVGVAAWMWYSLQSPYKGFAAQSVFVDLPHGASSRTVARLLKQNGVIRSATAFEVYARRHPKRRLQAGEYFFDHPISGHDVFWQIADGHVYEQPFTVREGETIFDIAHDLEAEQLMTSGEFLAVAQNPELIRDIAPRAKSLEGFLFPATYFLPRHPSPTEVAAEMVRKFREEWQRIAPPEAQHDATGLEHGRPLISVVTLASLVERETPKPEERPLVAGKMPGSTGASSPAPICISRRHTTPMRIPACRPVPSAIPAKPPCAPHSIRQKRITYILWLTPRAVISSPPRSWNTITTLPSTADCWQACLPNLRILHPILHSLLHLRPRNAQRR
jgi:YceG-like family